VRNRISHCGLRIADCELRIADFELSNWVYVGAPDHITMAAAVRKPYTPIYGPWAIGNSRIQDTGSETRTGESELLRFSDSPILRFALPPSPCR
jgi:hypothetical protein